MQTNKQIISKLSTLIQISFLFNVIMDVLVYKYKEIHSPMLKSALKLFKIV